MRSDKNIFNVYENIFVSFVKLSFELADKGHDLNLDINHHVLYFSVRFFVDYDSNNNTQYSFRWMGGDGYEKLKIKVQEFYDFLAKQGIEIKNKYVFED